MKAVKTNVKFEKENKQNLLNTISIVYFLKDRLFTEVFSRTTTIHPGIFRRRALYKQQPPFGAKICSDICPQTLSDPSGEQFSESVARGKL